MTRKITYASARNKGKKLERDIAKALKNLGIDAKRVPMSGALSWLKGDVVEFNSLKAHLHECKNQEDLSLNTWWQQSLDQCLNEEVPVLHFTSNYQQVYTMLDSEAFDDMLYSYEQVHRELRVDLVELPARKNFWKFIHKKRFSPYTVFTLDDRVIILFDTYLILRRADIKRRALEVVASS